MKMKRNPITDAVQKALFTGFIASSAFGTVAMAQEDESVEEQGKITVTGSRIKRSDVEGALPVTVISREEIELSGESSAADFLRSLTFNSTGSFRPQSGSSAQGTSSISLRGLGSSRTLVLIDGRRLPKSPSTGGDQDLNTIPAGAIERIEILSDGASAVYGSDAIGGVVNIVTRTDYEGAEIMLGGAEVSVPKNGGEREEGSIVFGAAGDRSRVIAGVSWNGREIVFARDFPWYQRGVTSYGNNMESWFLNDQGTYDIPFQSLPGGACDQPGAYYELPLASGLVNCSFDFASVSADEASTDNQSFYAKASYDINDNWQLWSNISVSETESFGRYAPVPDWAYVGPDSNNNPTNPNSTHYAPELGVPQQAIAVYHRFDALGNRDSTVTNRLTNFQMGFTGMVGAAEVEIGVTRANNRTSDIGRNYLLRSAAKDAINNGSYDLWAPYDNDPDVLNGMKVVISRIGRYDQDEVFGSVAFDLFDMAGGPASIFIGAEQRNEKYSDQYDSLSEAGQIGGSAGNSAAGTRDITSVYFETLMPVLDNLEVSVAGRWDDYSDYGDDFSPKVSVRFQPLDNLTLRASYGEGFRAPSMDLLTQKESFSATSVNDDPSCVALGAAPGCILQVDSYSIANPGLESETSSQYSVGLAYEPTDWFNVTLDYYNINIENRIRAFSVAYLLQLEEAGDPLPPGLSIARKPSGAIDEVYFGFGNQGEVDNSGLDLNMRFTYDLFGGNMSTNVMVSHLLDVSVDGGRNNVKDPGTPADRMVISNLYSYGDWSFAYNMNLIGNQYDSVTRDDNDNLVKSGNVPTWVTHDVQLNYHAPWNGKFTLGARNVGEKLPPIGLGAVGSRDYDFFLYDGFGRTTYFRYTQTF
ncbi:TonB-dependent receptor plug domain-containing protein [Marinicella rhabdoformis]|uniref:TonB-dependent receptor plug domain-containing protein n=1 Tax=Marinicella rhabdoformis TaxID=2580566 RepID=UPI001FEA71F9|nr:TonB-dependent receptor [Marinicella rhabdoformis]